MIGRLTIDTLLAGEKEEIQTLFTQLSPTKVPRPIDQILRPDNHVFCLVYRESGHITGIASLGWYEVLSGNKGWIEDVVVDRNKRGQGIGKALIKALLIEARQLSLTEVFLYTEKEKEVAIGMYQNFGFQRKDSSLYTLKLGK
jgi:ribosomal protein S18 acetylase RimI-like enzyme